MQEQRPHQDGIAAKDRTRNGIFFRAILDLCIGKKPVSMRAWNHAERTVILAAIIQMNTNREHLLQNGKLRAHVNDIGLGRPWTPAFDMEFLSNGNHAVLMPGHLPVRFWTLVEKDSSYREAVGSEHQCHRPSYLIRTCDGAHDRVGEQVANSMPIGVESRL